MTPDSPPPPRRAGAKRWRRRLVLVLPILVALPAITYVGGYVRLRGELVWYPNDGGPVVGPVRELTLDDQTFYFYGPCWRAETAVRNWWAN